MLKSKKLCSFSLTIFKNHKFLLLRGMKQSINTIKEERIKLQTWNTWMSEIPTKLEKK